MTVDEKLAIHVALAIREASIRQHAPNIEPDPDVDLSDGDRIRGRSAIAALRAAGWLLIPPLDTPEGREAVERARLRVCGFDICEHPKCTSCPDVVSAMLRAAGDSHE